MEQVHKKKRRVYKVLLITLAVLLTIRICLPFVVLHFVNKKLAALEGYYGHVKEIDIALYRGAYVMNGMNIQKVDIITKEHAEFFSCPEIDLSVEWKVIFKGKIVAEVVFNEFDAIWTLLKNAFIKALEPYIERSINISEVSPSEKKEGFLKRFFSKDKK